MQRHILLVSVIAGLVGAGVGAGALLWYMSGPMQQNEIARLQFEAAWNISVLEELRAGKTETTQQLLEGRIDSAVVGLHSFALEGNKHSPDAISTLRTIAKYRSGVSYSPSTTAIQAGVPQILEAAMKGHLTPQSKADAR